MFSLKFSLLAALVIGVGGCAQPHYGGPDVKTNQTAVGKPTPSTSLCPISFPKIGYCGVLNWLKSPSDSDVGTLELSLWPRSTNHEYRNPEASLFVFMWMPDMGHPSRPTVIVNERPGHFVVNKVFFTMPGGWDIHLQFRSGSKVIDEAVLPFEYEGGG